jgi:hypothetical protein
MNNLVKTIAVTLLSASPFLVDRAENHPSYWVDKVRNAMNSGSLLVSSADKDNRHLKGNPALVETIQRKAEEMGYRFNFDGRSYEIVKIRSPYDRN